MRLWPARVVQTGNTSLHKRSRGALAITTNVQSAAKACATPLKTRRRQGARAHPTVDPTSKPRVRRTSATHPKTRSFVDRGLTTIASYGAATSTMFAILHVRQPDQKCACDYQQCNHPRFRNRRCGPRVDWLKTRRAILLRSFENNRATHRRHELIANGERRRLVS